MSKRTRFYVLLALAAMTALVLSRIGEDWSDGAFYGALAGLVALFAVFGNFWVDMAPDGALRRRPRG